MLCTSTKSYRTLYNLNITEQDLDEMGGYPLPRQNLAKIHNDIINAGAYGVGWVMLFPHEDRMGGDIEFAKALQVLQVL
ncbi:MAG: hypothetical protein CM15mV82_320 [uncultured marine virus]|nr:MAG: hypothetical protein CM15mV82_320 [uncultured marine virus]